MMKRIKKRYWVPTILSVLFFCIFSSGYYAPLTFRDFLSFAKLRMQDNVTFSKVGNLASLNKNLCETPVNCQCVYMIHGLGDQAMTWKKFFKEESSSWSSPVKMVAVNLPGSGRSTALEQQDDYHVRALAELLFEHMRIECHGLDVILVSNSFGSWIGAWMNYLDKDQEYIKQHFMLNPAGLGLNYSDAFEFFSNPNFRGLVDNYRKSHLTENKYDKRIKLPGFILRAALRRIKKLPTEEMVSAQKYSKPFTDDIIQDISDRSYVIWGENDDTFGFSHIPYYKEFLDANNILTVDKCAHMPQVQCFPKVFAFIQNVLSKEIIRQ